MSVLTDLLAKIEDVLNGRSLLSLREQLLDECYQEIKSLQARRLDDLEKAAKIVEDFNVGAKTVVGKMQVQARKDAIVAQIRELK